MNSKEHYWNDCFVGQSLVLLSSEPAFTSIKSVYRLFFVLQSQQDDFLSIAFSVLCSGSRQCVVRRKAVGNVKVTLERATNNITNMGKEKTPIVVIKRKDTMDIIAYPDIFVSELNKINDSM